MKCDNCGIPIIASNFIPEYKGRVLCLICTVGELK